MSYFSEKNIKYIKIINLLFKKIKHSIIVYKIFIFKTRNSEENYCVQSIKMYVLVSHHFRILLCSHFSQSKCYVCSGMCKLMQELTVCIHIFGS